MILLLRSLKIFFLDGELNRVIVNLFLLALFALLDVFGLILIAFLIINFGNLGEALLELLSSQRLLDLTNISENKLFVFFCIFTIFYSIFNLISTVYVIRKISIFSQLIGAKVKSTVLNHFLSKKWPSHSESSFSENISRIINDGDEVAQMINFLLILFSRAFLALIIVFSLLFFDFYLTLYFVSVLLIAYFTIFYGFKSRIEKNGIIVSNSMDANMQVIKNLFGSIKEIIFYDRQKVVLENFNQNTFSLANARGANIAFASIPRFLIDSIIILALVAGIIYFNFYSNLSNSEFITTLSVFGIACLKLLPAFQNIFYFVNEIYARVPNLSNINTLLESETKIRKKEDILITNFVFKEEIRFKNVSFRYPNRERFSIKDINLTLKKGQKIALIGQSGSGKSTVIDLLLRFNDPDEGSLLIDQKKVSDIEINEYRKNFSYIPQKIYLFEGSLSENISFNQKIENSNLDKLHSVLSAVELIDFVERLPKGLDTYISDDIPSVSGGQKQRIGIARSLFRGGEILILDEGTNSLDPVLERKIFNSIEKLKNYTIICITHHISSLENFDRIYLLNDGKIDDSGTFEELRKTNKVFVEMLKNEKND